MAITRSRVRAQGIAPSEARLLAADDVRKADDLTDLQGSDASCWKTGREEPASYPTVLVGVQNEELRRLLTDKLRRDEFLVLEADNSQGVLNIVIQHSRPIHLLFLEASMADPEFPALLKQFRSYMRILFVTTCSEDAPFNALPPDYALAAARELLTPLKPRGAPAPDK